MNYLCQLLNAHGANNVRQTAEPSLSQHSYFEDVTTTEKLKRYKLSGIDQILVEMIQAGYITLCSETHKLINFTLSKEESSQQCKDSITVPIYKKGDRIDSSNYRGISMLPPKYKHLSQG
jgi:hypothetical protein